MTPGPAPGGIMLISTAYPSSDDPYRNAFLHTRVAGYRSRGTDVQVCVVDPSAEVSSRHQHDGVDVLTGPPEAVAELIEDRDPRTVLIHFVSPGWFARIRPALAGRRVLIWLHGFEAEAWYRRWFNVVDDASALRSLVARRTRAFAARRAFFQELSADDGLDVAFVTVSHYFRSHVVAVDAGVPLNLCAVIPNPIDSELYTAGAKPPEHRTRVLTIRPFTSAAYGNDLMVEAVHDVATGEGGSRFRFTIIGDGPLFEDTLAPLQGLENVDIRRGFLDPRQIADEHRKHGVFLAPGRIDSQGVSRCEAMSSGLVPMANAVAAVPEFVEHGSSGWLAPPEDWRGLARGLRAVADDPELFARMSMAASERVRSQCAARDTIPAELGLLLSPAGAREAVAELAAGEAPAAPDVDPAADIEAEFARALSAIAARDVERERRIRHLGHRLEKSQDRIEAFQGSHGRALERIAALEGQLRRIQERALHTDAELQRLRGRPLNRATARLSRVLRLVRRR
ncbi:glycosyltransferase [Zafaria sp. Z1313]|uniref:glycosyltransferase family 4 protein n=1 Tax=Zafaria sp. Z1313 TaxID=3423202 RepID=UPI003D302B69